MYSTVIITITTISLVIEINGKVYTQKLQYFYLYRKFL